MAFWLSAASIAAKLDRLRVAEQRLLELALRFGASQDRVYKIDVLDTLIPRSVVPLVSHDHDLVVLDAAAQKHTTGNSKNEQIDSAAQFVIHGIRVTSKSKNESVSDPDASVDEHNSKKRKTATEEGVIETPLVLLHGYMNGAAYFYRNLIGLSNAFASVYSLDLLGWGLSSRPRFELQKSLSSADDSDQRKIRVAEDFFVESLEAWRRANDIPVMILAGHSMGGYIAVAYAERYPQHVERLVLLSPAGVPVDTRDSAQRLKKARQQSFFFRVMSTTWYSLYEHNKTPGTILRLLPSGKDYVKSYIEKRLPAITDPEEQNAVAEYLYVNNILPGSGEYSVHAFLTSSIHGRSPTEVRIPHLQVPSVTFLYGANDWMDVHGGLRVQARAQQQGGEQQVAVYSVRNAGHLLMLDNWQEFNAGIILAAGGRLAEHALTPIELVPSPAHYTLPQQNVQQEQEDIESVVSDLKQDQVEFQRGNINENGDDLKRRANGDLEVAT